MKIQVTYDARPIKKHVDYYICTVKKYLKSGFKLMCVEDDLEKVARFQENYGDVIFKHDGTARGWNTLTWRYIRERSESK